MAVPLSSAPRAWGPGGPGWRKKQGVTKPQLDKMPKPKGAGKPGGGGGNNGVGAAPGRTVAVESVDPIHALFQSTLAQMQQLTPQVDATAIRAPYEASKVATGQLGEGWNAAELASGQKAQDQFSTARDEAMRHAAASGISAGADPNANAVQDNMSGLLAQQTQANASAATSAAAAWQGLLERTAGAAVGKAQQNRQDKLDTAGLNLLSGEPAAHQNAEQLDFQRHTAEANNAYLYASLGQKGKESLRNYLLDVQKYGTDAAYKGSLVDQGQQTIDLRKSQNAATVSHWGQQLDLARTKMNTANAKGVKFNGLTQVMATLNGPKAAAGAKTQQGYLVTYRAHDDAGFYGPQYKVVVDNPNWTPGKGNAVVTVNKNLVAGPAAASGTFSWSRWKAAYKMAKALNPTWSDPEIRNVLPATPSTKKPVQTGH